MINVNTNKRRLMYSTVLTVFILLSLIFIFCAANLLNSEKQETILLNFFEDNIEVQTLSYEQLEKMSNDHLVLVNKDHSAPLHLKVICVLITGIFG